MQKGKYGIYLWFYAAIAFILAILGQTLLCGLLLGFVIVAERDEWLSRQVIQAFCLCFFNAVVSTILGIFDPLERIPPNWKRVFFDFWCNFRCDFPACPDLCDYRTGQRMQRERGRGSSGKTVCASRLWLCRAESLHKYEPTVIGPEYRKRLFPG